MTEEDIRKLSEECALYYQGRPSNKGYELSNRLTIEGYAKMVLKWLSDKFCIAEKEKVKNFLELSEVHALDAIDAVEFIEDIFGKDIFNDTEK